MRPLGASAEGARLSGARRPAARRRTARQTKVDHKTVSAARAEMRGLFGEIPQRDQHRPIDRAKAARLSKSTLFERFQLTLCHHIFYIPKVRLSKVGGSHALWLRTSVVEHPGPRGPGRGSEGRRLRADLFRE